MEQRRKYQYILHGNRKHRFDILLRCRPAHSRCGSRGGNEQMTFLALVPGREVDWPGFLCLSPSQNADAILCMFCTSSGLEAIGTEHRLDAAFGSSLDHCEESAAVLFLGGLWISFCRVRGVGAGVDCVAHIFLQGAFWYISGFYCKRVFTKETYQDDQADFLLYHKADSVVQGQRRRMVGVAEEPC